MPLMLPGFGDSARSAERRRLAAVMVALSAAFIALVVLTLWLALVVAATTYQPPTLVWTLTPATEVF